MDSLKLENQLCFPLYACAKEVVKKYAPFLKALDLTYTQYITMMVLWEQKEMGIKSLGEYLYLDSGTLTPLLKRLEEKELIKRQRSKEDERSVVVSITQKGEAFKEKAKAIPVEIRKCINVSDEEAITLYKILYKILKQE